MLSLICITLIATLCLALAGLPIALLTLRKLPSEYQRGAFLIGCALLFGFGIISVSSAWSFGFLGINSFGVFFIVLVALPTSFLLIFKFKSATISDKLAWDKFDFGIGLLFPLAALVNRVHIDSELGLGFRSGNGPDTAQNLMSFVGLRSRGETWLSLKNTFQRDVETNNLFEGLEWIYTAFSFQAQAVYDYLLYGTRWGLSVPASFANELLGRENLVLYPALISTLGVLSLGAVTYGFLSVLIKNLPLALCVSFTLTASGTLLYQTFNGGLAQAWALPGLGALSILLLSSFVNVGTDHKWQIGPLTFLTAITWITVAVPYFDAALVMGLLIVLIGIAKLIISRFKDSLILKRFGVSGLIASVLVLPFSLAAAYTLPIRLRLASGTGIDAPNWPLPSELFGFGNIWTYERTSLALGISVVTSVLILLYFIRGLISKKKDEVAIGQIGVVVYVVILLSAFAASISVAGNNYIYMKVGAYLAPVAVTIFYLLLSGKSIYLTEGLFRNSDLRTQKILKKKSFLNVVPIVPAIMTLVAILSSQSTVTGLTTQGVYFPKDFGKISVDIEAQKALTEFNYFLFYTPSSNVLGAFADVIWISKAPNDLSLKSRSNKEIRVLCYSFNKECTPPGELIPMPSLEKFGLLSYKTTITIDQYMALDIKERYAEAFKQLGQDPVVIPERYLGGNPLLKP